MMPARIQQISSYGSATPVVARTLMQGAELLQAFPILEPVRDAVKQVLFDLHGHLIRCVQISDDVVQSITNYRGDGKSVITKAGPNAVYLPAVPDLRSLAESFLQSAKLALHDTGNLLNPFYKQGFSHRFDKILAWSKREFPANDQFVECIAHYEPWVTRIVNMRNAVDHPADRPFGKLEVCNFTLAASNDGVELIDPTWCLQGEDASSMVEDMPAIVDTILCASEDLLSVCLLKNRGAFPLRIGEIPKAERDPACPKRLRAYINPRDIPPAH